ncbi:MAG: hypothetical protein H6712_31090 [Myxococcales bacterium]|nr:hypothetical protein [Myxococcales bacterium]MCB9718337.1 hypothetical protein [Myxococcales bacterium]
MRSRLGPSFLLGLPLLLVGVTACGDDSSTGDTAGDDSSGGNPMTSTNGSTTTPSMTDDGTGTDASDTNPPDTTTSEETDTAEETGTTTGLGDCQVWEITYDLEGSEFEISDTPFGAGDQVNVVTMPYDADDHVGPGTLVLRFQDVDGDPGGMAAMVSYDMSIHFVVDSGVTVVQTDLETDAGPDECGVTTGMLADTTVAWMPSAIVGHHSMGQILCTGMLCGAGGLPNGMPVPMDETSDQPISDFVFSDDLSSFNMEQTVIAMDANSTTAWTYTGTEVSREQVLGPACLCQ